ncbi:MAG: hypothetical protein ACXVRQ_02875 [Gaiellaceae bacterium]
MFLLSLSLGLALFGLLALGLVGLLHLPGGPAGDALVGVGLAAVISGPGRLLYMSARSRSRVLRRMGDRLSANFHIGMVYGSRSESDADGRTRIARDSELRE